MSAHTKGLILTILGVLFISPDTLLIRLIDLDVWTLAVWRGALQAIGLTIVLFFAFGRRTVQTFLDIGLAGILLASIFSINTFAFLGAIEHTSVANALIILASTPLFAAVMSLAFLKEPVATRTWIAISATVVGIVMIVFDSRGRGTVFGDALALLAAVLLAFGFIVVRARKHINMIPALVISGLMFSCFAMFVVGPPQAPGQTQLIWLLLMGFAVITPATALMTLGPRYISAPEVGLILLLETVLGPLWVWWVIQETPSKMTLLGGTIVVVTLMVHGILGFRATHRPAPSPL